MNFSRWRGCASCGSGTKRRSELPRAATKKGRFHFPPRKKEKPDLEFPRSDGRAELLQLFHRNRGIFLAEARRASPGVAAGLGHCRDVAEGGHSALRRAERNRSSV